MAAILKCFRGERCDDSKPQKYVSRTIKGYKSLMCDIAIFDESSNVPDNLSDHLPRSKRAWYLEILGDWRCSDPYSQTPQETSNLIARTLRYKRDILDGFLKFYNLPTPKISAGTSANSKWPKRVEFEISILPIGDGDGMTVHVNTEDPREYLRVPMYIRKALIQRQIARANKQYHRADELRKKINEDQYWFIRGPNHEGIFAKEYKIRLKGIEAPEMDMEHGIEAKDALIQIIQNKSLQIKIYEKDRYARWVGDVFCQGAFVQETLLKTGCAWHHIIFDNRQEFSMWEAVARNAQRGLWANPNPVEPWIHKSKNNCRKFSTKYNSKIHMKKE